jgi:hypothetical protein
LAPDIEVVGRAALLPEILCCPQGYEKDGKLRALQDCALFLQVQTLGLVVLTANVSACDILLVGDSGRNRVELKSRKFCFEIKRENFLTAHRSELRCPKKYFALTNNALLWFQTIEWA